MAGAREIKAVGPSYLLLADRKSASQRSVNLYMQEIEGLGEDVQAVLRSVPGLVTDVVLGDIARGTYATDTRRFIVAGNTLYELTTGTAVSRGTLVSSSGYVNMKHGRDQLVLVDGANGYVLNLISNVFAQITDPDWRGSDAVDELDGYFVFVDPDTDQFYLSTIDDGSQLDALDFSSADVQPDDIVRHVVLKRELFLFGTRSTEVWVDSGNADFPLVRYNSTPIDVGIVGKRAVTRAADTLVFVGQTERGRGVVYIMAGHQPVRISNEAVEAALASSTNLGACALWSAQRKSAEFVGINAPGMQTTWVWNASTKQWHEQGELVNGAWTPMRIDEVTMFGGQHYATAGTATTYRLDDTAYAVGSDMLVRERTWPHLVQPSLEPVSYRGLEIGCTTGYGGNITLEISNDGGFTFGPPLLRSLGAIGRWMQRVRWLALGAARDRVFRLRCSDAVPLTITSAALDV